MADEFETEGILQKHRNQAWSDHWNRFERAVISGNVDLAFKVQDQIEDQYLRRVANGLKNAARKQDLSPPADMIVPREAAGEGPRQSGRIAGPVGPLATVYDMVASPLTGGRASASGLARSAGFPNAARYIDEEKGAFVDNLKPAFDAMQFGGEVAAARASAGGPAGAMSNSIRLATSAPFTRAGREGILDARADRRLPEVSQQYGALRDQLIEHGGHPPAPVPPRPIGSPNFSNRQMMEGIEGAIDDIRAQGPQAYRRFLSQRSEQDLSTALPGRSDAMPFKPVPQGRTGVVDASVDPIAVMTPAERQASQRAEFRARQRAQQPDNFLEHARQAGIDRQVDDFVGQASTRGLQEGRGPVSNPAELARVLQDTQGLPVSKVLDSMERLGYRLDWLKTHHVQRRAKNGRFEPVDDRLMDFWEDLTARRLVRNRE